MSRGFEVLELTIIVAIAGILVAALMPRKRTVKIDGQEVTCGNVQESHCGVDLSRCDNGKKYLCQKDLEIIR